MTKAIISPSPAGRWRVESRPLDPARSLLLLKPTNAVPHKGGERFKVGSPEWETFVEWIAAGTPAPEKSDARVQRIEVLPANVRLAPGTKQQMIVRAYFNDGHVEDVTRNVKFTATNQSVANVEEDGSVTIIGHGESAITAWYLSKIATGTVSVPFPNQLDPQLFADAPSRNWIDRLVLEKLRSFNLPPSPRCSDEEFIRRAFIDTIGVLPTAAEVRAFLAETAVDKRDRLIAQLLERPEFVDYWTYKWSDLLLVTKRKLKPAAMWAYYKWVRDQVATNTPWDVFAKRLLTAQGSTLENGAANYFVIHQDPRDAAETTSQTFLGFSMNCAKCHNHPMEKWTNDDYFGFANLFSRVRFKNGSQDGENVVFATNDGELVQPLTGKPQPPRPLDGTALSPQTPGRSPDRARRVARFAGQSLFQAEHRQSDLGELFRRRAGRKCRRHPREQSREQRTAFQRGRGFSRGERVRSQATDARDSAKRDLSALERAAPRQQGRHALLFALLSAPDDGGSAP